MSMARQWLGSLLFTAYLFVSIPPYATWLLLSLPFTSRDYAYRVALSWVGTVLFLLGTLCRLRYTVEGTEYLQRANTVVLLKHSSAWETIAQLKIFPRQTWVIKHELMWAPFLGWALVAFKPIAIDRRGGRNAVEQVIEQGKARLEEGLWVMIFPEGTRVAPGETRRYGLSGALLATVTGRAVIPVAHNAGDFWPRRGLLKKPGTIRMIIGPPIATAGREPREVNQEARAWIEARLAEMSAGAADEL